MDPRLVEFAASEKQRERLQAWIDHGSQRKAAEVLGVDSSRFREARRSAEKRYEVAKRAALQGDAPGHFENGTAPGFVMGKVTVQRDAKGQVERTWERQSPEDRQRAAWLDGAVSAMLDIIEPVAATDKPEDCDQDLLAIYPAGDPHAGLYAWEEETGTKFDLDEFERVNKEVVSRLVESAPAASVGVLNNKGDATHADNNKNRTPRSGHELDVHGRHSEVTRRALRVMRFQVSLMLTKHETVIVRIDPGNHDPETALALALMLEALYENEPRVQVITSPNPYWYFQWGRVLIGTCHGDGARGHNLPLLMATDAPELWGATKYRYWFVGHLHHKHIKEYNGADVEFVRTLAARDSWAHGSGYRSKRDMQVVVLHKELGEKQRHTCTVDEINAQAEE